MAPVATFLGVSSILQERANPYSTTVAEKRLVNNIPTFEVGSKLAPSKVDPGSAETLH